MFGLKSGKKVNFVSKLTATAISLELRRYFEDANFRCDKYNQDTSF